MDDRSRRELWLRYMFDVCEGDDPRDVTVDYRLEIDPRTPAAQRRGILTGVDLADGVVSVLSFSGNDDEITPDRIARIWHRGVIVDDAALCDAARVADVAGIDR